MNEKIVLEWANNEGRNNRVEMIFEALDRNSTLVKIRESGWSKMEQNSLDQSYGNCMGWTQMLSVLRSMWSMARTLENFFSDISYNVTKLD
jgi:uncharacterized protein YndB with AHSA1/START domain